MSSGRKTNRYENEINKFKINIKIRKRKDKIEKILSRGNR